MGNSEPNWLTPEESETWLAVWSMYVWLPARLDAQLKRNSGLSHFDYFALAQISQAEDQTIRMRELAGAADMTLSHLSRVVTRLERNGWVERIPDPDDGRSTLAHLTPQGWEKVKESAPGHVGEVRRLVFDNLSEDEAKALGAAAKKIVTALAPPNLPH